ncbi:hypothetical protein F5X98DRAFT_345905 [Xylaria grammica]|nr:hypothetical protein F5X98DRAFT_345905 [Xylaria grammica]
MVFGAYEPVYYTNLGTYLGTTVGFMVWNAIALPPPFLTRKPDTPLLFVGVVTLARPTYSLLLACMPSLLVNTYGKSLVGIEYP